MKIALECFGCIFIFMMPSQVELRAFMNVESSGCHISSNLVHKTINSLALTKRSAHSTSEADTMTFLRIFEMMIIAPLLSLLVKKLRL